MSRGKDTARVPNVPCPAVYHVWDGTAYIPHSCRLGWGIDRHERRHRGHSALMLAEPVHESASGYAWTTAGRVIDRPPVHV